MFDYHLAMAPQHGGQCVYLHFLTCEKCILLIIQKGTLFVFFLVKKKEIRAKIEKKKRVEMCTIEKKFKKKKIPVSKKNFFF